MMYRAITITDLATGQTTTCLVDAIEATLRTLRPDHASDLCTSAMIDTLARAIRADSHRTTSDLAALLGISWAWAPFAHLAGALDAAAAHVEATLRDLSDPDQWARS